MAVSLNLEDDEALVLFEWFSREIDERKGGRLAHALVTTAEFWALNALHCMLERDGPAPFGQSYAEAVAQARMRLVPETTEIKIQCEGEQSAAVVSQPHVRS